MLTLANLWLINGHRGVTTLQGFLVSTFPSSFGSRSNLQSHQPVTKIRNLANTGAVINKSGLARIAWGWGNCRGGNPPNHHSPPGYVPEWHASLTDTIQTAIDWKAVKWMDGFQIDFCNKSKSRGKSLSLYWHLEKVLKELTQPLLTSQWGRKSRERNPPSFNNKGLGMFGTREFSAARSFQPKRNLINLDYFSYFLLSRA